MHRKNKHPIRNTFKEEEFSTLYSRKPQGRTPLDIVTDQYTSPTYVPNLSRMLIEISSRKIQGILHVAGVTRISRYDMAEIIAEKLHLDKKLLRPASQFIADMLAKRPQDSSLDVSKADPFSGKSQ